MIALHDAVENGIGDRRVADPGMPVARSGVGSDDESHALQV